MRTATLLLFWQTAAVAQYINPWHGFDILDDLPTLSSISRRQESNKSCGQIAESLVIQDPNRGRYVSADLAYECFQSVPVKVDGDLLQIQQLKEYLQFQSTLAYLKAGSKNQIEPYEIIEHIDFVAERVRNDAFKSEYDVQLTIRKLLDGKST